MNWVSSAGPVEMLNAGRGHHFRWKCDARTPAHPSATEGPHNAGQRQRPVCTPDFEDFARWDGVRARMRAQMAAYVGDAVLIAL